jgi:hypothetical protein
MICDIAIDILRTELVNQYLQINDTETIKIQNIIVAYDIDNITIDDTEGESVFPFVVIHEFPSEPDTLLSDSPDVSPSYITPLNVLVFDMERESAVGIAYIVQNILYKKFHELTCNQDESFIDSVKRGRKSISPGDFLGNKDNWCALRALNIRNRIEL